MSYLVFGQFRFAEGLDQNALKQVAFQTVGAALREGLHVSLGPSIVCPKIIHEMLGYEGGKTSGDRLPFLITDSPLCNTSDELISPYVVGLEGSESFLEMNLVRIRRFLVALTRVPHLSGAEIFFTEGYDTGFRELSVSADHFDDVALKIFLPEREIPSTKFIVSWSRP